MAVCQNLIAAKYALPEAPTPVRDRAITLKLQCRDPATFSSGLVGLGSGKGRVGANAQTFLLCDNHTEIFAQIDRELVTDGWAPSLQAHAEPL